MLQFVLGRAGSGKTETLRRMLAEESRKSDRPLVMLVPEQYSFETEKAILSLCGPERANRVQVYSFTRLAEAVFRKEGGFAGRRLSDGGRRILMSSALAACEDQLELYRGAAGNGRVTDLMLTAVNEMKMCGISPAQLGETARLLTGGLSRKLSEIALLYGAFEALVAASYLDSRDDLTRLKEALETSDFFRGAVVAVDSFEGFTVQELGVLVQILKKADKMTVSLCTDGLDTDECGLFALVERTRSRLKRAALEENVELLPDLLLTGAPRFRSENLKLVEAQMFSSGEVLTSPDHEGVEVFAARDVYEEAEFVAATIRRLVAERGWRYRDFSIICRSPERYYGSLDVALQKRDIPCFVSEPARVDAEPVSRFVLGAFEAVRSGYATDDLLEMLKTGVSGFTAEEISDLENYAFLWRLNGSDWREPFSRHPAGFGHEMTQEDRRELERLEALRLRLMEPLLHFAAATRDASGAEISQAVFDLLERYGMEENLPAYCLSLEEAGEEAMAARQIRVWDLLMELLDQMHSILGDRRTARESYYLLLKEVVSAEDVSEIPQTVDEVIFGTAEQVRQSSPKCAFLLGAAQGEFPLAPRSSGVFSDAERQQLIALELPLGDPLEKKTIEERYLAYSVICAPSEMLYVSWPGRAGGEEKEPGELVNALLDIFPTLKPLSGLPDEYFADSREAAFSRMAARFTEDSSEAGALRLLFEGEEEFRGRVEALERAADRRTVRMENPLLIRRIYGEDMLLSPTQIETFHSCPFKYFCRYGLNAKERRPAEVDVMQYGTLMHWLFENIFRQSREERAARSEEELLELVRRLIAQYAEEKLGGADLLSGREKYRLERLARSACMLILHVEEELAQSRFQPRDMELRLEEGGKCPPLKVRMEDGAVVTVRGTIDRVDTVELEDGRVYVRVVDYKTGRKQFRLADVYYGLNMQMLVYLAALVESGQEFPAGILYMPSAEPTITVDRDADEEAIRQEAGKKLKMSGLVLSREEIIRAMEAGARGEFIPASLNRNGAPGRSSSVLSEEQLRTVLEYSKRLIASMGEELRKGRAEARPAMVNQNDCHYCPYGPVCGREYGEKDVKKDRASNPETAEKMQRRLMGEEEHHG